MDRKKNLKAVLFDMDGTLITLGLDMDRIRKKVSEIFLPYGIKDDFIPILEKIETLCSKIKNGEKIKNTAFKVIEEEEIKASETSKLITHADKVLEKLKRKKIKTALITRNCRTATINALRKHNILEFFDVIITRDDGKWKPDPFPIIKAIKYFGISPKEALIVGDHPYDIIAGKRAGVITVAFLYRNKDLIKYSPDITIKSLEEILCII